VDGKGIEKLRKAGIDVELGILEAESKELNKRFFTFHTKQRPYIILKWAQTADGYIGASLNPPGEGTSRDFDVSKIFNNRLLISNEYSNRLVHKWRSAEAAILVGTNTALLDNPALTTRLWAGPSPIRLVLDMNLRLPSSLRIFNEEARTIIFNSAKNEEKENLLYYQLKKEDNIIHQMMDALYKLNIQSILVEGGAKLLQSFIDEGLWDEARIISNNRLTLADNQLVKDGLHAPFLKGAIKENEIKLESDSIEIFKPK
jgi:diaminohydroxyphosphoribosylaminopyrimidine deaminase/5-amino-6-(5-phosphoribosylamino)uracil reductase